MVEALGAREASDGEHCSRRTPVGPVGEGRQVEAVIADVHLGADGRPVVGVALLAVAAIELAARDDRVRVAQLLLQKDGRAVQVGPGVEPDGERDRSLDQPVKHVGARAGVVPPVGQDMIVAIGRAGRPGPCLGEHVDALGQRPKAEPRRGRTHRGRVAHEGGELAYRPRARLPHGLEEAQMMHAVARQDLVVQDVEPIAPQTGIERCNREHVDLHAGIEQRPHVTLEEGGDPRRIRAREHREPQLRRSAHHERPCSCSHSSSARRMNTRWYRPPRLMVPR